MIQIIGLVTTTALVATACVVAQGNYYTPRSNFGFYLGVVGALMMVAMLTYPLRKHVRFMQGWGALKHWFRQYLKSCVPGTNASRLPTLA